MPLEFSAHKIEKWGSYKRKFGPYWFEPCECGCTKHFGIGFQLIWFGVKVQFVKEKDNG